MEKQQIAYAKKKGIILINIYVFDYLFVIDHNFITIMFL